MLTTLAALALWMIGAPPVHAGEARVNEAHPEVRLPTIDGRETVSLQALRGKKVLLIQFASW